MSDINILTRISEKGKNEYETMAAWCATKRPLGFSRMSPENIVCWAYKNPEYSGMLDMGIIAISVRINFELKSLFDAYSPRAIIYSEGKTKDEYIVTCALTYGEWLTFLTKVVQLTETNLVSGASFMKIYPLYVKLNEAIPRIFERVLSKADQCVTNIETN